MSILSHFENTNALLTGHFLLSSGLHSPQYLQCALALEQPSDADRFAVEIATQFSVGDFDTVASPAIGGLVIGFAVARAMDMKFIWTERENGVMTLRRGFKLERGERILVVEDVITTGGSTRECIAALEQNGGKVIAASSIIDRSNGAADVGVPRISLARLDVPSYTSESCPLCESGVELVKPGSRKP